MFKLDLHPKNPNIIFEPRWRMWNFMVQKLIGHVSKVS